MKASSISHPNIAFVKYWGKKDKEQNIPTRRHLSMTLSDLETHTTLEFSNGFEKDIVILNGVKQAGSSYNEVIKHVNKMREYENTVEKIKVVSENNFPTAAGIASSASGFSALTVAVNEALGLGLDERELSRMSGYISGSAARSIKGGFVEFHVGDIREECYAEQVFDENYWDLRDIVAVVNPEKKKVSSRQGMDLSMKNCSLYDDFVKNSWKNVESVKKGLAEKNFKRVGETLELDSLMLHSIMMTTKPHLFYWVPTTLQIMKEIMKWREQGILAYHTVDAGPNVHIITTGEFATEVEKRTKEINGVKDTIHCGVGGDATVVNKHLF